MTPSCQRCCLQALTWAAARRCEQALRVRAQARTHARMHAHTHTHTHTLTHTQVLTVVAMLSGDGGKVRKGPKLLHQH